MNHEEHCGNNCGCGDSAEEESQYEELVENNAVVLDALIDLLIEKGIITEELLTQKIEDIAQSEDEDEELEDEDEDEELDSEN